MNSTFKVFFFLFLAVLFGGAGMYFWQQNLITVEDQPLVLTVEEEQVDEIMPEVLANTITNEEFGFTVSYPERLVWSGENGLGELREPDNFASLQAVLAEDPRQGPGPFPNYQIKGVEKLEELTLEEYAIRDMGFGLVSSFEDVVIDADYPYHMGWSYETDTIGGRSVIWVILPNDRFGPLTRFYVQNDDVVIKLVATSEGPDFSVIREIIESIKF